MDFVSDGHFVHETGSIADDVSLFCSEYEGVGGQPAGVGYCCCLCRISDHPVDPAVQQKSGTVILLEQDVDIGEVLLE